MLAITALLAAALWQDEAGFEKLFNGKDFTGFKFFFKKKDTDASKVFKVEDGIIDCAGIPQGYMYTEKSYRDFTLRFDWRFPRPDRLKEDAKFWGNSGYLIFITEHKMWPKCIEVQGMYRDAGMIIPIDAKAKFEIDADAQKKAKKPVGEWNTMEIRSKGGVVTVTINELKVSTITECELKEGPIGFQSEVGEIQWRNIRIKAEP